MKYLAYSILGVAWMATTAVLEMLRRRIGTNKLERKNDMENDFSNVKIGDKVFHITDGWSTVINKDNCYFYIQLKDRKGLYTTTGRISESDLNPVVFWDEIKIIPPPKPKRKIKKIAEWWLNVYKGEGTNNLFFYDYKTKQDADERADKENRLGEAYHVIHKYTIEE